MLEANSARCTARTPTARVLPRHLCEDRSHPARWGLTSLGGRTGEQLTNLEPTSFSFFSPFLKKDIHRPSHTDSLTGQHHVPLVISTMGVSLRNC